MLDSRWIAAWTLAVIGGGVLACGQEGAEGGASASDSPANAIEPSHEEGPEVELAGRVLDQRRAPLAGARVVGTCKFQGSDEVRASFDTRTDERGAFRIDALPAGDMELDASIADHRPELRKLGYLGPIDAREDLEFVLADGRELGGHVSSAAGAPASATIVFIEDVDWGEFRKVVCDAQGSFLARGLGEGPFRVTAITKAAPHRLATVRGVPAGTRGLELVLHATGVLEVAAKGVSWGAGKRCYATLLDPDGVPAGAACSAELREALPTTTEGMEDLCRISGLEPGSYWLDVQDEERSFAAHRLVELEEGRTTSVEVVLAPATCFEVSALEDGTPVLFELMLQSSDGYIDRSGYRTDVLTDFVVRRLVPPGSYRVEARGEVGSATAEVTLSGEPRRELRLELE